MSIDISGLGSAFDFASKIVDKIFPDKAGNEQKRSEALFKLNELQQTGELAELAAQTEIAKAQIAVNTEEAKSNNLFVAGARPFIMWVCGFALAYHFVVQPLLAFSLSAFGHKVDLPVFEMETLNTVLFGLLGLGGLRSYEKVKGVV
jgi:hypothetical protein